MGMGSAERWDWDGLSARLRDGVRQLGLSIDGVQVNQMLTYLELLNRWNGVHSLSAWRSPSDLLLHHALDSMTLVGPLRRYAGDRSLRILDAGSGPGFPAAVLAIMCPAWSVTAVDAVAKKIAFVRQAATESGVLNLVGLHARFQEVSKANPFDVVVSRALGSLGTLASQTRHMLAPGGVWIAQKGRPPEQEISELAQDFQVFHVEHVTVPGLDAQRCLVWMKEASQ
jgi:16S rRNA (guanine527-N7)-methyltransferase